MIRVRAAGDAAVLLEPADVSPAALAAAITAAGIAGVIDVIPGATTVLVSVDPTRVDLGTAEPGAGNQNGGEQDTGQQGTGDTADLTSRLARLPVPPVPPAARRPALEIDVCYDGPDLADVAAISGLTVADVIARHQAASYEVGWLGFSPGFGYLTGLDPALAVVPRLDTPRLAVPAGSVAIAGGLSAVYPADSPGGWRIIGRTSVPMWDPGRDPAALLAPGLPVRFRAVSQLAPAGERERPGASTMSPPGGCTFAAHGGRSAEVLQPGPLTTVQDLGRAGFGHLGVPGSGAADAASLRAANALVGNDAGAACLEVTLGRLALRFGGPAVLALTGATAPVRLTGPDGARAEPAEGAAFEVGAGTVLRLGAPAAGLRSYLAVDGGFDVPPVLGSRSADLLSGLGPAALRAGQHLPLGPRPAGATPAGATPAGATPAGPGHGAATATTGSRMPTAGAATELRVIPGPRDDWFEPGALAALTGAAYLVTPASDRTGLRLSGPPLRRARTAELPSEGVATGSLQVSHDGQPILLLADHPATGGYPVIAVVRSADTGTAAQLRPGQQVRFRVG